MEILSIGTVITLKNGEQKLMITSRYPLYDQDGEVGYFDYAGCFYPEGQYNEDNYFFNSEDIETVHFEGYKSEEEILLRQEISDKIGLSKYNKLHITK